MPCTVSEIVFDMSNVAIFGYPFCVLLPTKGFITDEGVSLDDLRKILHVVNGWLGYKMA